MVEETGCDVLGKDTDSVDVAVSDVTGDREVSDEGEVSVAEEVCNVTEWGEVCEMKEVLDISVNVDVWTVPGEVEDSCEVGASVV